MSGAAGSGNRLVLPIQQVIDPTGLPIVGAQLWTYATGTSTFQNTYADAALTIPNANPVVTDSAGRFPNVFLIEYPAYRMRLEDAAGAVIWDVDPAGPAAGIQPGTVPIGAIMGFVGTAIPTGWLLCDGSTLSRVTFKGLFDVLGEAYGAGDALTTFAIPDLRGRVIVGLDTMGGVAANRVTFGGSGVDGASLAASGGDEMLQFHGHIVTDPGHTHTDAGHTHTTDARSWPVPSGALSGGGSFAIDLPLAVINTGYADIQTATTGVTVGDSGVGGGQNMPPCLVLNYIIFTG